MISVGGQTLSLVDLVEVSQPTHGDLYWLDATTAAASYDADAYVTTGTHGQRWPRGGSISVIDLSNGESHTVVSDGVLSDIDRANHRFLVKRLDDNGAAELDVIGWDGTLIGRLSGEFPRAAFLSNGSVAVVDDDAIASWAPGSDDPSWSSLPAGFATADDATDIAGAVGDHVLLYGLQSGLAALVDPTTGTVIGNVWKQRLGQSPAVEPDGTRFAIDAPQPDVGASDAFEILDSATADVIATTGAHADSGLIDVIWPTDDILLVLRKAGSKYVLDGYDAGVLEPQTLAPLVTGETSIRFEDGELTVLPVHGPSLFAALAGPTR